MPLGLGPFGDQLITTLLLIVATMGGLHLFYERTRRTATQDQTLSTLRLTAEEIVRERYARGEINRRQFQEMMTDLREGLTPVL